MLCSEAVNIRYLRFGVVYLPNVIRARIVLALKYQVMSLADTPMAFPARCGVSATKVIYFLVTLKEQCGTPLITVA